MENDYFEALNVETDYGNFTVNLLVPLRCLWYLTYTA